MCTTGALRLGEDDYLLFKNKDFVRSSFEDEIVLEREVFGVEGVSTWAGNDPDRDEFSGFSIGANSDGLLVCDSNVRTLPDHENYDRLVEIALRSASDVRGAVPAVEAAVARENFVWANLILIDATTIAGVEVRGDHINVEFGGAHIARSNHHPILGAHPEDDDTLTSERRLRSAMERLERASSFEDVVELQKSHDDGSTGVCNHSLYQTLYQYVLRRRGTSTDLYVAQGRPCEQSLELLPIPLGDSWSPEAAIAFREAYPSARAVVDTAGSH